MVVGSVLQIIRCGGTGGTVPYQVDSVPVLARYLSPGFLL
jgi:hypothetical protein